MQTGARAQHCCATLRRSHNNKNIGTCCTKSLTGFKLYATSANIVVVPCKRTYQVATLFGPTMLRVVGQQCCIRLHRALQNVWAQLEDCQRSSISFPDPFCVFPSVSSALTVNFCFSKKIYTVCKGSGMP